MATEENNLELIKKILGDKELKKLATDLESEGGLSLSVSDLESLDKSLSKFAGLTKKISKSKKIDNNQVKKFIKMFKDIFSDGLIDDLKKLAGDESDGINDLEQGVSNLKDITDSIEDLTSTAKLEKFKENVGRLDDGFLDALRGLAGAGKDKDTKKEVSEGIKNLKGLSDSVDNLANPAKVLGAKIGINMLKGIVGTGSELEELAKVSTDNIVTLSSAIANLSNPIKVFAAQKAIKKLSSTLARIKKTHLPQKLN